MALILTSLPVIPSKCSRKKETDFSVQGPTGVCRFLSGLPSTRFGKIRNADREGFDLAILTAAYLEYTVKNGRSGEIEIEIQSGPRNDPSPVKIETPMIGLYFDCDILVQPAKIIGDLEL